MKTFGRFIAQRLREIAYLLVSFPISVLLFVLVMLGFNSATFIPLSILIFLFVLTSMEWVARSEIWRTNKILGTDFVTVPSWFIHPFFSWDGVKERVTSLRSWMAVGYVFIAFGWSIFSLILVLFAIAGVVAIIFATGSIVVSSFSRSFELVEGGDRLEGSIRFFGASGKMRLELGDGSDSGILYYSIQSWWSVLIGVALVLLALWLIPRNTRAMAGMVEGLLSATFYPRIDSRIKSFLTKRNPVDKRSVRDAIADEVSRPELAELSKREREILALMAEGKSNSGIAKTLYITEGSVEKHISSILSKLGLTVEEDSHRRVLAVLTYLGINR